MAIETILVFLLAFMGMMGGFTLAAFRMRLRSREHRAELEAKVENPRMTELLEDLAEQIRALHEGQAELQERLDFTERLLVANRDAEQPADTPEPES